MQLAKAHRPRETTNAHIKIITQIASLNIPIQYCSDGEEESDVNSG